jgi:hypothetical protein
MALKIVHLCDVHSQKGEDIPASFAHTIALDGGTYAIDLCPSCDSERFLPLAAFLDAFGLLTDGAVDPREAVSENLRAVHAQQSAPKRSHKRQESAPAPSAPPRAPERSQTQQSTPATAIPIPEGAYRITRERVPLVDEMLREAPEGLSVDEITERLDSTRGGATTALDILKAAGRATFTLQKWWAPENVPAAEQARSAKLRATVAARNSIPRVCPVDGESLLGTNQWDLHCLHAHSVRPAELLGLTCPIDGETFSAPQVLGMHARQEHECAHTPLLFEKAAALGDSLGIIAAIRARFA